MQSDDFFIVEMEDIKFDQNREVRKTIVNNLF